MQTDLELARNELAATDCALVIASAGKIVARGYGKGIKPLFDLGEDPVIRDLLPGASLADRVVGRGVALLARHYGLQAVYGLTLSEPSRQELRKAGIECAWAELVPRIMNQTKTGYCPVESLVENIQEPAAAEAAIRAFLQRLKA